MKVNENKNFKSVSPFTGFPVTTEMLKASGKSLHMQDRSRAKRIENALRLDSNPEIDRIFLVDKGHRDGMEVHVVTKEGFIYVFNNMKLFLRQQALVTILVARPNQVERLYEACRLTVDESIIAKCREHQMAGLNNC